MAEKKFSIGEAIGFGWNTALKNIVFFIGLLIIVFLVNFIPGYLAKAAKPGAPFLALIIGIVGWVLQMIVSLGLIKVALRFCDNEKPNYTDLFNYYPLFFNYLIASTLYGLAVLGGLILLIVPGIIWAIQFSFFPYFIVEKGATPGEALKKSSALTKGVKWGLFLFYILIVLFNILGFVVFVVGLLVTIPVSLLAQALVYRKLLAQSQV